MPDDARDADERSAAETWGSFESLFRGSGAALLAVGDELRVGQLNEQAALLAGSSPDALRGRPLAEVLPDLDGTLAAHVRLSLATQAAVLDQELVAPSRDQGTRRLLVSVHFLSGPGPRAVGVVLRQARTPDLDPLRRALEENQRLTAELQEQRAQLDAILEQLPVGLAIADGATRRVPRVNGPLGRRCGTSLLATAVPSGPGEPCTGALARALDGQTVTSDGLRVAGEAGEKRLSVDASPVRAPDGRITGAVAIDIDLTDRRAAEEGRRATEQRLADLLETMTDGFLALDRELRISFVNAAAERMIERKRAELIGRPGLDVYPDARGTVVERECRQVLATGRPARFETYARNLRKHYEFRIFPSTDGLSISFNDATARVRATRALAASEARFRSVVENAPIGMFFGEPDGRVTDANDAFLRLAGYARHEFDAGAIDWRNLARGDAARREAAQAELDARGTCTPQESELVTRDGTRVPVLLGAARVDGKSGATVAFVVDRRPFRDVREAREQLARSLDEERALLRAVIDQLPCGLILLEPGGHIAVANRRALELSGGAPMATTLEERARTLFREDGTRHTPESMPLARSLLTGEVVAAEVIVQERADGTRLTIRTRAAPVRVGERIVAAVATLEDMSAERQDALERQRRDSFRDLFIGMLGHDLRNPLAAILTSAALMDRRGELTERDRKTSRRILSAGERMARMINQLLDLTRSRLGGGMPVERQPTNLHQLVQRVTEELQATWHDRRIEVSFAGDGDGRWDPDRLGQVVSNLVCNALEHGAHDGPVVIAVDDVPEGIRVRVTNRGVPIPPDVLGVIFDPFSRAPGFKSSGSRGLGLGLHISQQVAEAHGGTIEVVSPPEGETTFTVVLPRAER